MMEKQPEDIRLDKWLWAARFFKTRSQAAQAVSGGKVHLNGNRTKPAHPVQINDQLVITKDGMEFHVTVLGIRITSYNVCYTKLLRLSSYAISETQKFGHVTYFWNGNRSGYIDEKLEKYDEILSDRVTFDLRPWMKAAEIADNVIAAIKSGQYSFIRANLANGDMVGHTGVVPAVRIAVETVDLCLGRILHALEAVGGVAVITADHGNADS